MSAGLVSVLFVAAGLVAVGAFISAWKKDLMAALAGLPLMFAGAGSRSRAPRGSRPRAGRPPSARRSRRWWPWRPSRWWRSLWG